MNRRIVLFGVAAALALAVGFAATRSYWSPPDAVAQAPKGKGKKGGSVVPVDVATAVKKSVPVRVDLLGTVTPIASVAVKPRIDSEIIGVHFDDGATVRKGDLLFTLDNRAIEAQMRQIQGQLDGAKAQLSRRRVTSSATPRSPPRTPPPWSRSTTPRPSSTSGRQRWSPTARSSNFCGCSATIPSFARRSPAAPAWRRSRSAILRGRRIRFRSRPSSRPLPSMSRSRCRNGSCRSCGTSVDNETATIEAIVPGDPRHAKGQVTMIENTVDAATGTVFVRATMPNQDEVLWPGTLVQVRLDVPRGNGGLGADRSAPGQPGRSYVYVVDKQRCRDGPAGQGRAAPGGRNRPRGAGSKGARRSWSRVTCG